MAYNPVPLDSIFLALADPTRRAVIARLGQRPAAVSELAEPFDMALPSFMKHVRMLEEAGLIRTIKRGRVRTCEIDRDRLNLVDGWLDEQRRVWESRTDRLEDFLRDARPTEQAK
jgi:DNA-binding transcriptional ArsR family regulator